MTRAELLDAASNKLEEAASLLIAAGEERLAADVVELADWVDFSALPFGGNVSPSSTSH
jgi:hypothetical protein